jgi:hypothetical protein
VLLVYSRLEGVSNRFNVKQRQKSIYASVGRKVEIKEITSTGRKNRNL